MALLTAALSLALCWGLGCEPERSRGSSDDDDDGGSGLTAANGVGSSGVGGAGTGPATTGVTAGGGEEQSDPQAPTFLSFGANNTKVTPSHPLTLTAVLTDPDGIDDLVGGQLTDSNGATYGAFTTSSQEGAYSLMLTWEQIDSAQAIETLPGEMTPRHLTATFFDQAGHTVSKSLTIEVGCDGNNGACNGYCVSQDSYLTSCFDCGMNVVGLQLFSCGLCSAHNCCAEGKAVDDNPNTGYFFECYFYDCNGDAQCEQDCIDYYPSAYQALLAWDQCRGAFCANDC